MLPPLYAPSINSVIPDGDLAVELVAAFTPLINKERPPPWAKEAPRINVSPDTGALPDAIDQFELSVDTAEMAGPLSIDR